MYGERGGEGRKWKVKKRRKKGREGGGGGGRKEEVFDMMKSRVMCEVDSDVMKK